MVTQIDPRTSESSVTTQEKVEEAALAEAEEILRLRRQAEEIGPWARFQHWLAARYGEFAGPPMTEQERINARLHRAAQEKQSMGYMWW